MRMGRGAQAEVSRTFPIIEVVSRLSARLGEVRDLVMLESLAPHPSIDEQEVRELRFLVGQFAVHAMGRR